MNKPNTPAEWTALQIKYWDGVCALRPDLANEPLLRGILARQMQYQIEHSPLQRCKKVDELMPLAERIRTFAVSEINRKAARYPRNNSLNDVLEEILREHPGIEIGRIPQKLKQKIADGVITAVTDTEAYYKQASPRGETDKSAKLSGLKDRISRIEKKIRASR